MRSLLLGESALPGMQEQIEAGLERSPGVRRAADRAAARRGHQRERAAGARGGGARRARIYVEPDVGAAETVTEAAPDG
jgi:hypothetical protein